MCDRDGTPASRRPTMWPKDLAVPRSARRFLLSASTARVANFAPTYPTSRVALRADSSVLPPKWVLRSVVAPHGSGLPVRLCKEQADLDHKVTDDIIEGKVFSPQLKWRTSGIRFADREEMFSLLALSHTLLPPPATVSYTHLTLPTICSV